jgi:hypothetical protein
LISRLEKNIRIEIINLIQPIFDIIKIETGPAYKQMWTLLFLRNKTDRKKIASVLIDLPKKNPESSQLLITNILNKKKAFHFPEKNTVKSVVDFVKKQIVEGFF